MRLLVIVMLLSVVPGFGGEGKSVVYTIGDKKFEGYFADAGKKAPFILLIHDWDGLTDYEVQRSEMFKKLGYTVFAADLFGKGIRPKALEDKKRLTGALYADRTAMRTLMNGAIEAARSNGAAVENGVAIGYCFGGAAVLELARAGVPLKGFITFHGGLATPEGQGYTKTKGKVLILHGSADQAVPVEQFTALAGELEKAHVDHEMILYGGADHAFTVFGGERYNREADKKSWNRCTGFLKELFGVSE